MYRQHHQWVKEIFKGDCFYFYDFFLFSVRFHPSGLKSKVDQGYKMWGTWVKSEKWLSAVAGKHAFTSTVSELYIIQYNPCNVISSIIQHKVKFERHSKTICAFVHLLLFTLALLYFRSFPVPVAQVFFFSTMWSELAIDYLHMKNMTTTMFNR